MSGIAEFRFFGLGTDGECVWGWDLQEREKIFINGVDEKYFDYVAKKFIADLDGESAQHAATAIRASYALCLETLFTLVGSCMQAPGCAAAWSLKAWPKHIRLVCNSLRQGYWNLPTPWNINSHNFDFLKFSQMLIQYTKWSESEHDNTAKIFSDLLIMLCDEYLDEKNSQEYNSIKHGFRARSGGFRLSVGIETTPGSPAPPERMKSMGGSDFGSSFYYAASIFGEKEKNSRNFSLRRRAINWSPDDLCGRISLASLLIANMKSFLHIANGAKPSTVEFHRLIDEGAYTIPWQKSPSVTSIDLDLVVSPENVTPFNKDQILEFLSGKAKPPVRGG